MTHVYSTSSLKIPTQYAVEKATARKKILDGLQDVKLEAFSNALGVAAMQLLFVRYTLCLDPLSSPAPPSGRSAGRRSVTTPSTAE